MNLAFTYPNQSFGKKGGSVMSRQIAPRSITLYDQIEKEMNEPNPFSVIDKKKEIIVSSLEIRSLMGTMLHAPKSASCGSCSKK